MMENQLNKNINEILKDSYVIPLYQRNFAWREEEISQFIQDIYETYQKNKKKNYYIGSLVVIRRSDGRYEIIDGQQRVTVITLIAKFLDKNLSKPNIRYDSRPEVENFFDIFYHTGDVSNLPMDNKLFHLINAVDYITNTVLNPNETLQYQRTILNVDTDFKDYFFNNVVIVTVEMPVDTDVAAYFEIMNNRGEQLYKHEIVKARLLSKIEGKEKQQIFSEIWDACSQMNTHIQKLFKKDKREKYFGNNYNDFLFNASNYQEQAKKNNNTIHYFTIEDVLSISNNDDNIQPHETIEDVDDDDKSIIDFPNFLMHVFRLLYNNWYCGEQYSKQDIPLNEKYLLDVYDRIEKYIEPMKFIEKLLFYRVVFDRFVIKATKDENAEDDFKWSLLKAYKYHDEKRNDSLKYKNSFEDRTKQEYIIKALSMLQVTFRQRIYKNWLQVVLSWFRDKNKLNISSDDYIQKLNQYILNYYKQLQLNIQQEPCYSEGTRTPHFLLNFIDYLYWIKDESRFNFDFKYRNSIEHHLPQSFENKQSEYTKNIIDCLGNLFLISKSSNSRMNNEAPEGKASENGKYYRKNLPPKQKIMYDITNKNRKWGKQEITEHYKDIVDILNNAESLLNKYNR